MKIILSQEDIELAIIAYVADLVTVAEGYEINVEKLIAGRAEKGMTAEVDISEAKPEQEEPVTQEAPKPVRRRRQKAAVVDNSGEDQNQQQEATKANDKPADPPVQQQQEEKPQPTEEPEDPPFVEDKVSEVGPDDGTVQTAKVEEQKQPEPQTPQVTDPAPVRRSIFSNAQRPTNS